MTALRATFHFKIRGLLVERELLGTSYEIDHAPYRMRLTLPSEIHEAQPDDPTIDELDRRFPARERFPLVRGGVHMVTSASMSGESIPEVTTVRVECFFEGEIGAADFDGADDPKNARRFAVARQALRGAHHAAREVLGRLLESVRIRGQHWLGPDSGAPTGLAHGELDDLDAGRRLPVTLGMEPDLVIKKVKDFQVLDAARIAEAVERAQAGAAEPMEMVLRADALYMLQDAEPPDYPRAVLTAAIACELRVKTMLREHATEEQAELVALLLKRPPMSVQQLFHQPLKILAGKSLCDDAPDLYRRLGELIERRNGLAHKGEEPPGEAEAREHVKAAAEVFRWLDAVEEGGG